MTSNALPWPELVAPLTAAEDAVARLDERLRASPIREGWIARTHFSDAAASLWRDGEYVDLEDLVLHDAGMDIRAPTDELVRAHTVLRARRRIAGAAPGWPLSSGGLDGLRGRVAASPANQAIVGTAADTPSGGDDDAADLAGNGDEPDEPWAAHLADLDRLVARTEQALLPRIDTASKHGIVVYDLDWDEDTRLAEWRAQVSSTAALPPLLAAALAAQAWEEITPLQHMPWLGRLLTAALLRTRQKTRSHLLCFNMGLRALPRARRPTLDGGAPLVVLLEAMTAAAEAGLKDHDRWLLARRQLERKLAGRRSTSSLPGLVDLILATPIASANMIARHLSITPRAAQNLVAELGLREATGRGRYRAWGIL